jgi:peptidoglycan/LPS O-acetylase OafA/YrhL
MPISTPSPAAESRRFYELDSLRGLAALTVVFHHFSRLCSPRVQGYFFHTPLRLLIAGHQAVILFFLLSGFVLTLPYQKKNRLGYGPFLLKRVCRIYLPYLGALLLAILGDLCFSSSGVVSGYWLNLTWTAPVTAHLVMQHILFLGNYDWAQFNTAFWSLVYEMRISLVFPFLALAVLRLRGVWIALFALTLSLATLPLTVLFSRVIPIASHDAAINTFLTLHYAAFFLAGSLMAKNLPALHRWYARLGVLQSSALIVLSLLLYTFADSSSIIQRFSIPADLYDWPVAAGAMLFILLALNSKSFHVFLTSRLIHHLGKISYSLYLIHGTVLFALVHTLYGHISMVALLLIYLTITLGITEVFYVLVEHPTMLLGRRLTASKRTTAPASAALIP